MTIQTTHDGNHDMTSKLNVKTSHQRRAWTQITKTKRFCWVSKDN